MKNKISIIIEARSTSKRLPKKILLKVKKKTLLEHLINRLKKVKKINNIIIATTTNYQDDKIVEKSDLVDQYLSITNKYYIKKIDNNDNTEICNKCNIPLICLQHDAIMICNNCGYQELLLVEQNRPILKQNTKDIWIIYPIF